MVYDEIKSVNIKVASNPHPNFIDKTDSAIISGDGQTIHVSYETLSSIMMGDIRIENTTKLNYLISRRPVETSQGTFHRRNRRGIGVGAGVVAKRRASKT